MTERTANQIEAMKQQTIGVEVEMNNHHPPEGRKGRRRVLRNRQIREHRRPQRLQHLESMGRTGQGVEIPEGRFHRRAGRAEMRTGHPDPDLPGHRNPAGALQTAPARRRKSDASRGCGVHIHIGAKGPHPAEPQKPRQHHGKPRKPDRGSLNLDRSRMSRYCRTVDPRFLEQVNTRKPKTMADLADIWYTSHGENHGRNHHYNGSRYHLLNLHATFTKATVEFRLFQFDEPTEGRRGGIHAGQVKSYIQLCLALSQMAKMVKTASPKPQQNENPQVTRCAPGSSAWDSSERNSQRRGISLPETFPETLHSATAETPLEAHAGVSLLPPFLRPPRRS